jgi:hypothetical protein
VRAILIEANGTEESPVDHRRAREIVLAWINDLPIEAELDDAALHAAPTRLDNDVVKEAFHTLASAPETTSEEFEMFVAGNYRKFLAKTEHLSARQAAKRARPDLDSWQAEATNRRGLLLFTWNLLKDLSPFVLIGAIGLAVLGVYFFAVSRAVQWLLSGGTFTPSPLADAVVVGISFVGFVSGLIVMVRWNNNSVLGYLVVWIGIPFGVAFAVHGLI